MSSITEGISAYKDASYERRQNYTGSNTLSAEEQLTKMYEGQRANFDKYYAPLIDDLEKELNSTEILDRSVEDAANLESRTQGQVSRSLGIGGDNLTVAQQRALDRSTNTNVSKGEATLLNLGRTQQQAYTEGVTTDLMNVGTALENNSVSGLTTIAANQQARELEYANAKSGLMSNILGTVGAVGGAIVGGPVGAGIGGAVGSTIGGSI